MQRNTVTKTGFTIAVTVALLAGCGHANGIGMDGYVTLDGLPIESGNIVFQPMTARVGGASAGADIVYGQFTIPPDFRIKSGKFRVEIIAVKKTGRRIKDMIGDTIDELQNLIPNRYNKQSELTAEITSSGPNHFEFALTSK